MSLARISEAQVRHYVAQVRRKVPGARLIGIRTRGGWAGSDSMTVAGVELPVIVGRSPLQVREALLGLREDDRPAVLLTDLDEHQLGGDVVGRLARHRLYAIDSWQLVCDLFGAKNVDSRLANQRWLADALLEVLPQSGPDPVPAGVLDYRTAWTTLLRFGLGFEDAVIDLRAILEWALEPDGLECYQSAPEPLRAGLRSFLEDVAGLPARLVTGCLEAGYGSRVVPIGLVCRCVFAPGNDEARHKTAIRLESYVGEKDISRADALAWASEAEGVVLRRLESGDLAGAGKLRALGDDFLAKDLVAPELARASHFLPSSFKQRLVDVSGAVDAVLTENQPGVARLESAVAHAAAHIDARPREDLRGTLEMLPRLARWLVRPAEEASGFAAAARRYLEDGSFVDWARKVVSSSTPGEPLGSALVRLADAIRTRRETQSRSFAIGLAAWSETPSGKDVLPIEHVIDRVVVPLAEVRPVLLLVLDGMGLAVFHELLADIETHGWIDLAPEDDPRPLGPVIATLPSVTEFSRASLLAGKLCRGDQRAEKLAFETHAGMRAKAASTHPPRLFHKGDLRDHTGGVAAILREALQDPRQRILGVVVNAIDDHLDSGGQLNVRWSCRSISPLLEILDAAAEADRVVVLTADHGHVLERGTDKLGDSAGERWREASSAPSDGEIVLSGPRMFVSGRERVVLPWSEGIRYGPKKGGYHGGASPQEVVVPLAVLSTPVNEVPGWADLPPRTPAWWEAEIKPEPEAPEELKRPAPEPQREGLEKAGRRRRSERQPDLFAVDARGAEEAPTRPGPSSAPDVGGKVRFAVAWIDTLLESDVFREQRERNRRQPIADDRIRTILITLEERGGKITRTALARHLGLHEIRLRGTIAAMRKLLNVEGYDVLSEDESGATVTLNRELLFKQFGIESR